MAREANHAHDRDDQRNAENRRCRMLRLDAAHDVLSAQRERELLWRRPRRRPRRQPARRAAHVRVLVIDRPEFAVSVDSGSPVRLLLAVATVSARETSAGVFFAPAVGSDNKQNRLIQE
jgi:hypothetical protein